MLSSLTSSMTVGSNPGTVTIIRCAFKDVAELTVCLRDEDTFVAGRARPATVEEVKHITTRALGWF